MAKDLLGKTTGALRAFAPAFGKACVLLMGKAVLLIAKPLRNGQSGTAKKRSAVFIAGGLATLFLVLLIVVLARNLLRPGEAAPADTSALYAIPSGELFIPDEPDFIPGFILEREPRNFWSVEDIRPYWRVPGNPEFWQGIIRSAVDEIMENVP